MFTILSRSLVSFFISEGEEAEGNSILLDIDEGWVNKEVYYDIWVDVNLRD